MVTYRSFEPRPDNAPVLEAERRALFDEINAEAAATAEWTGLNSFDPHVMNAMARVPRQEFVPPNERPYAWLNRPLPIGHRQTISQPFIVALMTNLLQPKPDQRIFEVGTGSGYQAAVLSRLVSKVFSIELNPALASSAAERLSRLGYHNVEVRAGDGAVGWPEHGPFDGIIVTAAAPKVPPALMEQLKVGGRMIIPVDAPVGQELLALHKTEDGRTETRSVLPVAFVPLRGLETGRR
jgi:protein-L-isoaspartate(D-aspartate) O-methyltransferase